MLSFTRPTVVLAIVLSLATSCAGTEADPPRAAEETPVPEETPTEEPEPEEDSLEEGFAVDPGSYVTSFDPPLSVKIGSTSWIVDIDRADALGLFFNNPDYRADLLVVNPTKVYDAESGKELEAPDDLLGYFAESPFLKVFGQGKTTVAGTGARYLDVTIGSFPKGKLRPCDGGPCIPLFPMSVGPMVLSGDDTDFDAARLIEFDVKGEQILVSVIALKEESSFMTGALTLDELLVDANKVLRSMRFE